jgi:hypothetical protein
LSGIDPRELSTEDPDEREMRLWALLCVPGDASFEEAKVWLTATYSDFSEEVITAICAVHSYDEDLRVMRMAEYAAKMDTAWDYFSSRSLRWRNN